MIEIVEVAPRDGLQNEQTVLPAADKLALVGSAVAAGIRRVEVTSFVRADLVPQLADAAQVAAGLPRGDGVAYSALVLNERGYHRAREAGFTDVNAVVLATETFSLRNQGRSVTDTLTGLRRLRQHAEADGIRVTITIGAAFGCPFEGEVPIARLGRVLAEVADLAPHELALADTIGAGVPSEVEQRFALAARIAPGVPLRAHFHDTRNTGVANAVAAVRSGVTALDASLAGTGGCPFAPAASGNVATEDLAYTLTRMGLIAGLDLPALLDNARWLAGLLGKEPAGALSRAGLFPAAAISEPARG